MLSEQLLLREFDGLTIRVFEYSIIRVFDNSTIQWFEYLSIRGFQDLVFMEGRENDGTNGGDW